MREIRSDHSGLPPYVAYPRFLLTLEISETAKLVYVLLLDRARVSRKNRNWVNEDGYVYVYFTISSMAQAIRKCEMTVKNAYRDLEKAGLIRRERQGKNHPNRIYVRLPGQTAACPPERQNSAARAERNLSGSNNQSNNHTSKDYEWGEYL